MVSEIVRKLAALYQSARAMNSILDLDVLLNEILSLVEVVFSLDACAILMHNPKTGAVTIRASRGYRPEVVEEFQAVRGHGVTGKVIASREPLLVNDVRNWDGYVEGVKGALSEMAAPLRLGDQVIGVLDAESRRLNAFRESDLELFGIFADQAATAIHNARLVQQLERRNVQMEKRTRQLLMLNRLGQQMNSNLSIDSLLQEVLEMAKGVLHFDHCAVLLLEEEGGENVLAVRSSLGYRPEVVEKLRIRVGQGITGRVLESGQPVLVPDVKKNGTYIEGVAGGRCEMAAPLIVRGEVIGVLDAEATEPGVFSQNDLNLFSTFASWAAIALHNARLFENTQQTYYETIRSLAQALEARDAYTKGHSERVTRYAIKIAKKMGLSDRDCKVIQYAGLLHDIGKIGIADSVLNKRLQLSDDEWTTIQNHPLFGDNILGPLKFLAEAQEIVLHHHECFDGTGYPDKLAGDQIPLEARIIGVADAYDAMTSDRPYRKAMLHEDAVKELKLSSGSQFDPKVVETFLSIIDEILLEMRSNPRLIST
jgi:HD-GYP domain-containing protein (c-di-GMP phosphodiesterase class II)